MLTRNNGQVSNGAGASGSGAAPAGSAPGPSSSAGPGPSSSARSFRGRFLLAPSIDLLGGGVVRLRGGDPAQATVYSSDPAAVAARWIAEGADVLHVVDLDGALAGSPVQGSAIRSVLVASAGSGVVCEVAGGMRDEASVEQGLTSGADRVVVGTGLVRDRDLGARLVARHGSDRIVAAVDVRDGLAVGEGWRAGARGEPVRELVARLVDAGIATLEVTAIARDGAMAGPDLRLLTMVRGLAPRVALIASAGIRDVRDVLALRDLGCDGAILGRAIYEGSIALQDARAALGG